MNIVLATGGSLGHVAPAVLLANNLRALGHTVYFVGALDKWEALLEQNGFNRLCLDVKGVSLKECQATILIGKAMFECRRYFKKINAHVVVGFGSYSSVSGVFAGKLMGLPTIIHEQNIRPGKANQFLGFLVKRVAISFEESYKYFPKKRTVLTGLPCKVTLDESSSALYTRYKLNESLKTILVFGGSQGSHQINQLFLQAVATLGKEVDFQVIHITGEAERGEVRAIYAKYNVQAYVSSFVDDMAPLYTLSDLVIARSGASTVTELALLEKKSLLVHYQYSGIQQFNNAQVLEKIGLAQIYQGSDAVEFSKLISLGLTRTINLDEVRNNRNKHIKQDAIHLLTEEVVDLIR
ncbi:MAG: UDP-N-acetylglucosamine--N-acetylmuramyl-(pentapeptide) pyrophosphoryl-undecaprenol N-acetylglucosamine transferase [Lysobacterales bacterium]|jgi:UDP-N-acetylglucosamine--N-acetylmuramyl-(pentapeptide) pyrophosphoryl-undecaprenol N-acetylglucosamine transferase